jgi:transposase
MNEVSTVGVDLAKSVFQLHGVDDMGKPVLRRQLRRSQMLEVFQRLPGCLVGMEACASAHYWARELTKLGHEVRLMQPSYVKGYVKRGKTDKADAEAICEGLEPVAQRSTGPVDRSKAENARQRRLGHPCALSRSRVNTRKLC